MKRAKKSGPKRSIELQPGVPRREAKGVSLQLGTRSVGCSVALPDVLHAPTERAAALSVPLHPSCSHALLDASSFEPRCSLPTRQSFLQLCSRLLQSYRAVLTAACCYTASPRADSTFRVLIEGDAHSRGIRGQLSD